MAIVETIVFSTLPNSFYSLALDFVIGKRKRDLLQIRHDF